MKFHVHWRGPAGDAVWTGPHSLDNAIDLAVDQQQLGQLLYITDDTGRRLTLKAAEQLKVRKQQKSS